MPHMLFFSATFGREIHWQGQRDCGTDRSRLLSLILVPGTAFSSQPVGALPNIVSYYGYTKRYY